MLHDNVMLQEARAVVAILRQQQPVAWAAWHVASGAMSVLK
jgi:hypothetical protein